MCFLFLARSSLRCKATFLLVYFEFDLLLLFFIHMLMLDMYDFKDDIWLCHLFHGQCYNFTAFVTLLIILPVHDLTGLIWLLIMYIL